MKRLVTEGAELAHASVDSSARDRVRSRRLARKRRRALRIVAVVLAVCGLVGGTYALGFWYFSSRYYPGTHAVGVDAAFMTQDEFAQAIDAHLQRYELHASKENFNMSIPGSAVGLKGDSNAISRDCLMSQDARVWPLELLVTVRSSTATLSLDTNKLAALVNDAVGAYNARAKQPVSATLELNGTKDGYVLKGETAGTALDASLVLGVLQTAMAQGEDSAELTESVLAQPTFTRDSPQAQEALVNANDVFGYDIGFMRDGKQISHLDAQTFMPWLVVQDDLTLGVDQKAAAAWVEDELRMTADYADDKNAYSVDANAFAQSLSNSIQRGKGASFEVPYIATARYLPGDGKLNPAKWNPEKGRYIDVNKKAQVACLFDESGRVLWETPVTTGNESANDGTPTGEFAIYDKKTDFTLLGKDSDADGKPDYKHHVDFWMPFNGNIGLHDASWRSTYGGTEYLENGSGGCVNVPKDAVDKLYAITHKNETVLVHE